VGHVLRYSPYFIYLKALIESGAIGELISMQHLEPVGWFHFAHSYVRGNWRNQKECGSSSLLAKCCHDVDLINWFMRPCSRMSHGKTENTVSFSSFGSLQHFRKDKKPALAQGALKCVDCSFESQCPYSAKKIYLDSITKDLEAQEKDLNKLWPASVITDIVGQ
jgi:predicted dehydrogenase